MNIGANEISLDLSQQLLRYVYFGAFENAEKKFLLRFLKEDDLAVDVGANYGLLSAIMLCRIKSPGRVLAFEPNPNVFNFLSTLSNSAGQVYKPYQLAVSDVTSTNESEMIQFFINPNESMLGSAFPQFTGTGKPEAVRVETTTLTDFFRKNEIKHLNFIKIDVEGAESNVIRGLLPFLENGARPTIMCEVSPLDASQFERTIKLISQLTRMDYKIFEIGESGTLINFSLDQLAVTDRTANLVFALSSEVEGRMRPA